MGVVLDGVVVVEGGGGGVEIVWLSVGVAGGVVFHFEVGVEVGGCGDGREVLIVAGGGILG